MRCGSPCFFLRAGGAAPATNYDGGRTGGFGLGIGGMGGIVGGFVGTLGGGSVGGGSGSSGGSGLVEGWLVGRVEGRLVGCDAASRLGRTVSPIASGTTNNDSASKPIPCGTRCARGLEPVGVERGLVMM